MKRILIALAAVLVLAGAVGGIYATLGEAGIAGDESGSVVDEEVLTPPPIPTFAVVPTTKAAPVEELVPEPTATPQPPPSEGKESVTPAPLGCPDCAVKATDQLRVEVKDIQLGADGKYFVPDRGDGCRYEEQWRLPSRFEQSKGLDEVLLWAPGCELIITFVPATGEIRSTIS